MWYLLNAYWIPLLLAGLLGVIVGWVSCNNRTLTGHAKPSWFSGWVPWGIAAAALAALAVLQMLLPGKQGLLLDTALMLFGAYMLGCCVGCLLRPKPAAHLTTAGASLAARGNQAGQAVKLGSSGKAATAATVGTAATAAGLAAAKASSQPTAKATGATATTTVGAAKSTTAQSTAQSAAQSSGSASSGASVTCATAASTASTTAKPAAKSADVANLTSTSAGTNGSTSKVVTALGAAATGVVATAAAAASAATTPAAATVTAAAVDSNLKVFTTAPKFGERPALYSAPRGGKGDELALIWGVAEKLEHKMNAAGIWHFDQIANWTIANVEWFEHEFEGFKGRLDRDKWIEQCKKLAAGWRPDGHVGQRPKG